MTAPSIYLDHAATTPVAVEVLDAMWPWFRDQPGNAHSRSHAFGWAAAAAVRQAREAVAALLDVAPETLTFTSGATESITVALLGLARRYRRKGRHVVTTTTEHSAVLWACRELEREGFDVCYLDPDPDGVIAPQVLAKALRPDTVLCAVLWGNNETGVLQDMRALGAVCRERGVLLFADATQVCGKVECQPRDAGIAALACSAHKFYGPKGIGALYLDAALVPTGLPAVQGGGGQEGGLRGGTLNVPGIVGMGAAAALCAREMSEVGSRLAGLRDALETCLLAEVPALLVNGRAAPRLPHVSSLTFRFTEAEALLSRLERRLAASTGSACASADLEPSHVLLAMGLDVEDARATLRISLGRDTCEADVEVAANLLATACAGLRAESPAWELHLDGLI